MAMGRVAIMKASDANGRMRRCGEYGKAGISAVLKVEARSGGKVAMGAA